jgi:hypothetical protein
MYVPRKAPQRHIVEFVLRNVLGLVRDEDIPERDLANALAVTSQLPTEATLDDIWMAVAPEYGHFMAS